MIVILRDVRIAFPDLFTAKQFEGKGDFSYGATFLIDPESPTYKEVSDTVKKVATEKWADKAPQVLKAISGNPQKCGFYSGDLKEYDGFAGRYALSAKRKEKDGHPKVVDQKLNDLSSSDGKPYGGSYVNAKVDIWAQDHATYGKGIRATLVSVQFKRDGDAFSSTGPANTEGFAEEEGGDSELI